MATVLLCYKNYFHKNGSTNILNLLKSMESPLKILETNILTLMIIIIIFNLLFINHVYFMSPGFYYLASIQMIVHL